MENKPLLTVFTPAFNRAHTLGRTYESLKNQSCKDFIWLIVDDGSTDNTASLVKQWQKEDPGFEIQYIYKENGGMHTAHNTAYENIETELNVCIDSDDCMPFDAVESILKKWDEVKDKGYAGIIGLDDNMNTGEIIGTGFLSGLNETTLCGFYASGGKGDKKLVYRTEVINSYPPYPIFEGEKYVALAYKYRLIDQNYKLAVLNKVLCSVEYQDNGSSATMFKQYLRYPNGFAFWRKVCMQYPESNKRLVVDSIHYVSSCIIAKDKEMVKNSPRKLLTVFCVPAGVLLFFYIKYKARNKLF